MYLLQQENMDLSFHKDNKVFSNQEFDLEPRISVSILSLQQFKSFLDWLADCGQSPLLVGI